LHRPLAGGQHAIDGQVAAGSQPGVSHSRRNITLGSAFRRRVDGGLQPCLNNAGSLPQIPDLARRFLHAKIVDQAPVVMESGRRQSSDELLVALRRQLPRSFVQFADRIGTGASRIPCGA
jgi:hypothetical protein